MWKKFDHYHDLSGKLFRVYHLGHPNNGEIFPTCNPSYFPLCKLKGIDSIDFNSSEWRMCLDSFINHVTWTLMEFFVKMVVIPHELQSILVLDGLDHIVCSLDQY